jgi:hypothetical protein
LLSAVRRCAGEKEEDWDCTLWFGVEIFMAFLGMGDPGIEA